MLERADEPVRACHHVVIGELERELAGEQQRVRPRRISLQVLLAPVEAVAEQFDDDVCAGEATVDRDQTVVGLGQHLLSLRARQPGCRNQAQELPLQPAVPSAGDLGAGDDVEERGNPVPTLGPERGDSSVEEILVEQAITQRGIERGP